MSKVTIEDVCRAAWAATKTESSPEYDALTEGFRARLVKRALAVLAGSYATDAFETEVCQLADGRGSMQVGSEKSDG